VGCSNRSISRRSAPPTSGSSSSANSREAASQKSSHQQQELRSHAVGLPQRRHQPVGGSMVAASVQILFELVDDDEEFPPRSEALPAAHVGNHRCRLGPAAKSGQRPQRKVQPRLSRRARLDVDNGDAGRAAAATRADEGTLPQPDGP
jgi:hypothetical protein